MSKTENLATPLWNDPDEQAFQSARAYRRQQRKEQIARIVHGEADAEDQMLRHERAEYSRLVALKRHKEAKTLYAAVTKRIQQEKEHLQREIDSQSREEAERERLECEAASQRLKVITEQKRKAKDEKWEQKQAKLKARPKVSHRKVIKPVLVASAVDADGVRRTKLAAVPEEKKRKVRMIEYTIEQLDDDPPMPCV